MFAGKPKSSRPRLLVLANRRKETVRQALNDLLPWFEQRAVVTAILDLGTPSGWQEAPTPPDVDLAVVLGGDGTVLASARYLLEQQVPIMGVNFGKVGFLPEFNIDDLRLHWDQIVAGECRTTRRIMMVVSVQGPGGSIRGEQDSNMAPALIAMNDAIITAGPPYRMIKLQLAIDSTATQTSDTVFMGDGVLVSTPSGSTAYNLAAGGPIVSPEVDAFCVTPICPQSLAFRPIVVNSTCQISLRILEANEGTTLVIDGQVPFHLAADQEVMICRHSKSLQLIHNPDLSYWTKIATKMHWAARPRS